MLLAPHTTLLPQTPPLLLKTWKGLSRTEEEDLWEGMETVLFGLVGWSYLLFLLFIIFTLYWVAIPWHMCGHRRTLCESRFFLSTMWLLRIRPRPSAIFFPLIHCARWVPFRLQGFVRVSVSKRAGSQGFPTTFLEESLISWVHVRYSKRKEMSGHLVRGGPRNRKQS